MRAAICLASFEEGDVIHLGSEIRQPVRNPGACLAMLFPRALGRVQRAHTAIGGRLQILSERVWQGLAVEPLQLGLVVEQVERAGRPSHVQPDNRLRLGREVRRLRSQWIVDGGPGQGDGARGQVPASESAPSP